jgi:hypothetical protein
MSVLKCAYGLSSNLFATYVKESKTRFTSKIKKNILFGCILTYFLVVALVVSDKSSLALYDSLAISGIIYGFVYQLNSSFCHDMMPLKRMTTFPSATLLLPLAAKALKVLSMFFYLDFILILYKFYPDRIRINYG